MIPRVSLNSQVLIWPGMIFFLTLTEPSSDVQATAEKGRREGGPQLSPEEALAFGLITTADCKKNSQPSSRANASQVRSMYNVV
jgi:hypothetical protein